MQISHILSEYASKSLKRDNPSRKPPEVRQKSLFSDNDKVQISSSLSKDRLAELKSRVQSGFYTTRTVTDDTSDKMSNMFDNMTD